MSTARFEASGPLEGALTPPPDKSISHRAALFAAMAGGTSQISSFLDSADTRSTLAAVERLGAGIESAAGPNGSLDITIEGIGLDGPAKAAGAEAIEIDVGNAGTLMRLLPGWLAGQPGGSLAPRRRRVHPPPPGRPDRGAVARDGRGDLGARGAPAAA